MLERVMPGSLALEEIDIFLQAIQTDEHAGDLEFVAISILDGRKQLWRWRDDSSFGILLTVVNLNDDGTKELIVSGMAGEGLRFVKKSVAAAMEKAAKDLGCNYLVALVENDTIKKLYKSRLGFEEKFSFMMKEISHG